MSKTRSLIEEVDITMMKTLDEMAWVDQLAPVSIHDGIVVHNVKVRDRDMQSLFEAKAWCRTHGGEFKTGVYHWVFSFADPARAVEFKLRFL